MATFLGGAIGQFVNKYNNANTGSWGTKDLGITEGISDLLGRQRNTQGGSSFKSSFAAEPSAIQQAQNSGLTGAPAGVSFGNPIPQNQWGSTGSGQVLGTSTASRSAIPSSGTSLTGGQNSYNTTLSQSRDQNLSAIDQQFQDEMNRLGGLESTTRSNYDSAIQQAQSYYPQFQEQLAKEKATDLGSITNQEDQTKMESNKGLARTRQLLSDLQRSQAARMSATGNYSSSVADAFGESFGRKAFDANNQIQSSRDQALQQLGVQRQQTENFYSRKSLEAKQSYDAQLNQFQMQLQSQLDAIDNARMASADAKRTATKEAWDIYTNNKLTLDKEIMQYQDSLNQWKGQQDTYLQEALSYTPENVLGQYQDQLNPQTIGLAGATQPQSQTQQAMIMTNKKPNYWEDTQPQLQ